MLKVEKPNFLQAPILAEKVPKPTKRLAKNVVELYIWLAPKLQGYVSTENE